MTSGAVRCVDITVENFSPSDPYGYASAHRRARVEPESPTPLPLSFMDSRAVCEKEIK